MNRPGITPFDPAATSLLLAGGMCVIPFLQPRHMPPISTFYDKWLAFALGLAAIAFAVGDRTNRPTHVPVLAWCLALFSIYVALFASYNRTYGALGAAAILVTWLNVCAAAVLLGAIVNAVVADDRTPDHAKAARDVCPASGIGDTPANPPNMGGPAR